MSGHDPRCEWSKTPPARCRCTCKGTQHGTARVRDQLFAGLTMIPVPAHERGRAGREQIQEAASP